MGWPFQSRPGLVRFYSNFNEDCDNSEVHVLVILTKYDSIPILMRTATQTCASSKTPPQYDSIPILMRTATLMPCPVQVPFWVYDSIPILMRTATSLYLNLFLLMKVRFYSNFNEDCDKFLHPPSSPCPMYDSIPILMRTATSLYLNLFLLMKVRFYSNFNEDCDTDEKVRFYSNFNEDCDTLHDIISGKRFKYDSIPILMRTATLTILIL